MQIRKAEEVHDVVIIGTGAAGGMAAWNSTSTRVASRSTRVASELTNVASGSEVAWGKSTNVASGSIGKFEPELSPFAGTLTPGWFVESGRSFGSDRRFRFCMKLPRPEARIRSPNTPTGNRIEVYTGRSPGVRKNGGFNP